MIKLTGTNDLRLAPARAELVALNNMTNSTNTSSAILTRLQLAVFTAVILYFGRSLLVPLSYSLLIALVLYPVCKRLEQHRWPRSLAITAGLMIVVLLFGILIGLFVVQVNVLRQDVPQLLAKLKPSVSDLQQWIATGLNISVEAQNNWWQRLIQNLGSSPGSIIQATIAATAGGLFTLFLVPVFAALFLYNREVFVQFLAKLAGNRYNEQLHIVLTETTHTYFKFIKGMVMVYLIVGILNSIGLLALGIPHAILFGMLTAIMTIIPYVGIFISALLPITVAWVTKDSIWYPLGVVAVFTIVQYLEANLIFPKVVATQIKVSTWATLIAVVAGGLLWGVSGMILFIPFVGILKIVSDQIPEWMALKILLSRDERKKL